VLIPVVDDKGPVIPIDPTEADKLIESTLGEAFEHQGLAEFVGIWPGRLRVLKASQDEHVEQSAAADRAQSSVLRLGRHRGVHRQPFATHGASSAQSPHLYRLGVSAVSCQPARRNWFSSLRAE
jgi:hypothetical protein